MNRQYLWVIERLAGSEWRALEAGAFNEKKPARKDIKDLRGRYPAETYRLIKYAPYLPDTSVK